MENVRGITTSNGWQVFVGGSEAQFKFGLRFEKYVGGYLILTCPFIRIGRSQSRSLIRS